jgi:hypothetical protein
LQECLGCGNLNKAVGKARSRQRDHFSGPMPACLMTRLQISTSALRNAPTLSLLKTSSTRASLVIPAAHWAETTTVPAVGEVLRTELRSPFGPEPGAPPCIRQRRLPFTIGDWQGFPCRVRAPHRGDSRRGNGSSVIRCMGLPFIFRPRPPPCVGYVADDGLSALVDVDMLDHHFLLAAAPQFRQRIQLGCECPL